MLYTLFTCASSEAGTSLGLPRVFFIFLNLCGGLQPLDVILDILDSDKIRPFDIILRSQVLRIQSELNKIKAFTFYPRAGTSIRS